MIKEGAGGGGINDLIHCSEGDLSMSFLPLMCDIKAASCIMATLKSLEQQLHIASVIFFLIQGFVQAINEKAIFLGIFYQM